MATYVNDLRLKEIATGDESGTWGTSTNTNLELIGEALGYGTQDCFSSDADATTTVADGATDPARSMYFKVTSSATLTATRTLTIAPNTISRVMFIENATTGSQSINISQGSGANVTIATGKTAVVYLDGAGSGAAVVDAMALVDPGVTDTLAEVLVAGNTSGGTGLTMSSGDDLTLTGASYNVVWDSSDSALEFAANAKAVFGAGSDLQIYHNGSHSFINDTGTGDLRVLAANFAVYDAAGTNLRIKAFDSGATKLYDGTTGEKLSTTSTGIDVTGSVVSDGLTVDGNATIGQTSASDRTLSIGSAGATHFDITTAGATGIVTLNATNDSTAGKINLQTADTDRLLISNNGDISFYDTSGNAKFFWDASAASLGIGTTTPATELHVVGSSGDSRITVEAPASQNTWLAFRNTGGADTYLIGYDPSASAFRFYDDVANTERMRIDSSGNVGIGQSSPTYKLDISTSTTGDGIRVFSGGATPPSIDIGSTRGASADVVLAEINGQWDGGEVASIKFESGDDTTNKDDGRISFYTAVASNSVAERMRIEPDGNVGIGSTSPTFTTGSGLEIQRTTATATLRLEYTGSNGYEISAEQTQVTYNSVSSLPHVFEIGSAEKMRLDASGNVGINTSSPSVPLEVEGSVKFGSAATGISFAIQSTDEYRINGIDIDGNGFNSLHFRADGTDGLFIEKDTNNVGIGTSSPNTTLHVSSATTTKSVVETTGASSDALIEFTKGQGSGNTWSMGIDHSNSSAFSLAYLSNGSPSLTTHGVVTVDTSGNVGIGTSSPGGQVESAHTDTSTYSSSTIKNDFIISRKNSSNVANQSVGLQFDVTGWSGSTTGVAGITAIQPSNASSADLAFSLRKDGTYAERMRIDSDGNVSIGVTVNSDIDAQLHVYGQNQATANLTDAGVSGATIRLSDNQSVAGSGGAVVFTNNQGDVANSAGFAAIKGLLSNGSGNTIGHLAFSTRNATTDTALTERMRIDSSGNVITGSTTANNVNAVTLRQDGTVHANNLQVANGSGASGGTTPSIYSPASATLAISTGSAERMRIDSSGNLLVGKTSTAGTAGVIAYNNGALEAIRDGSSPLFANRLTSDGDIAVFRKDGTTVGSIGTVAAGAADQLYINSDDVGLRFRGSDDSIVPCTSAGAFRDAAVDLGKDTGRFKDLYLSGQAIAGDGSVTAPAFRGTDVNTGIYFPSAGVTAISRNGVEGCRMDANGNWLVGTTNADPTFNRVDGICLTSGGQILSRTGTTWDLGTNTSSGTHIVFYTDNGSARVTAGSISSNGSTTNFSGTSDYRLKENVVAMSGATERLKQLKPSRFNFIANPDTTVDGFLAHEVQDIVPEAITGTKDAVDANGNPIYQGIDQSKLVPLLVATIQELEARIAALEGAN